MFIVSNKYNYETFIAVWIFGHDNNHLDEKIHI